MAIYYCTRENNTCPRQSECVRFLRADEENNNKATLFKASCVEDNNYILFIKGESKENKS